MFPLMNTNGNISNSFYGKREQKRGKNFPPSCNLVSHMLAHYLFFGIVIITRYRGSKHDPSSSLRARSKRRYLPVDLCAAFPAKEPR